MLAYELVLILLGSAVIFWKRSRNGLFLIGWFAIGPLATIFTKDVSSTRLLHMIVPIVILEAVAYKNIIQFIVSRSAPLKIFLILAISTPIIFYNALFFESYFRHMPYNSVVHWGDNYFEIVELIKKNPDKNIYWNSGINMGYVYVLTGTKYNPSSFLKEKQSQEGHLTYTNKFGRFTFPKEGIDWNKICDDQSALYIESLEQVSENFPLIDGELIHPNGTSYFYYETTPQKCETFTEIDPSLFKYTR